jgi:hypothetical protein
LRPGDKATLLCRVFGRGTGRAMCRLLLWGLHALRRRRKVGNDRADAVLQVSALEGFIVDAIVNASDLTVIRQLGARRMSRSTKIEKCGGCARKLRARRMRIGRDVHHRGSAVLAALAFLFLASRSA